VLKESVFSQSGQNWKFYSAIAALLAGSFAPLISASGISWTSGTFIAVFGYLFGLIAIRCVSCGSRWFWEAAKDASLYGRLFRKSSCPDCDHDFSSE